MEQGDVIALVVISPHPPVPCSRCIVKTLFGAQNMLFDLIAYKSKMGVDVSQADLPNNALVNTIRISRNQLKQRLRSCNSIN